MGTSLARGLNIWGGVEHGPQLPSDVCREPSDYATRAKAPFRELNLRPPNPGVGAPRCEVVGGVQSHQHSRNLFLARVTLLYFHPI